MKGQQIYAEMPSEQKDQQKEQQADHQEQEKPEEDQQKGVWSAFGTQANIISEAFIANVPMEPYCDRPRRPFALHQKTSKAVIAQEWLKTRLADLSPSDFHSNGVLICMTLPMDVPSAFRDVSHTISILRGAAILQAKDVQLIRASSLLLVFCDIYDAEQLKRARIMASYVAALGSDAPHLFLVPHTSDPAMLESCVDAQFAALSNAMGSGCMDVVIGEPVGVKLACEVRSQLMMQSKRAQEYKAQAIELRSKVHHAEALKDDVQHIVWQYLIKRLRLPIPQQCSSACEPGSTIGNWKVGAEIGNGASGRVYKLEAQSINGDYKHCIVGKCIGQVLKAIPKKNKDSLGGLLQICNEVEVMQALDHPNIVKLHEVYHTETHVLFRMQDGGPQNLYTYLRRLERMRLPLSQTKAESIVLQCSSGLCHMHLGPGIAHRDLKPENIITCETAQGIDIKLCDFDLARICRAGKRLCSSVCGTFPFMAPEIGEGPYDPLPADIWAMGIVFLEVACCCNVLTKAASPCNSMNQHKQSVRNPAQVNNTRVRNLVREPDLVPMVVEQYGKSELRGLMQSSMTTLLEGMLTVQVAQRLTTQILQHIKEWLHADVAPKKPE